jgi:hypothetical protein
VLEQAEALTGRVLLLVQPGRSAAIDVSNEALRSKLQKLGRPPDYLELDAGFPAAAPDSCVLVYRRIEEFLNVLLNGYTVKLGAAEEVR